MNNKQSFFPPTLDNWRLAPAEKKRKINNISDPDFVYEESNDGSDDDVEMSEAPTTKTSTTVRRPRFKNSTPTLKQAIKQANKMVEGYCLGTSAETAAGVADPNSSSSTENEVISHAGNVVVSSNGNFASIAAENSVSMTAVGNSVVSSNGNFASIAAENSVVSSNLNSSSTAAVVNSFSVTSVANSAPGVNVAIVNMQSNESDPVKKLTSIVYFFFVKHPTVPNLFICLFPCGHSTAEVKVSPKSNSHLWEHLKKWHDADLCELFKMANDKKNVEDLAKKIIADAKKNIHKKRKH